MLPLTQQDLKYDNGKGPKTSSSKFRKRARLCFRRCKRTTIRECLQYCVGMLIVLIIVAALAMTLPGIRDNANVQKIQRLVIAPWQPLPAVVVEEPITAPEANKIESQTDENIDIAPAKVEPEVIQTSPAKATSPQIDWSKRHQSVIEGIRHAWRGYKSFAWGFDELRPISQSGEQWFHLGLTITDSLDTLWLAGLKTEFDEARKWVDEKLSFERNNPVNLFEVTIRVLGGLLTAFHLSQDSLFLNKARDLGDRLTAGFSSNSVIPLASVDLLKKVGIAAHFNGGASSTSEATTIQLEFSYLSKLTGNNRYRQLSDAVIVHISKLPNEDGLVPVFISPYNGQFVGSEIKLGARGDSYYEYLLKQYIQTQGDNELAYSMYQKAVHGIRKHLVGHSGPNKLTFIGEKAMNNPGLNAKMDHLVCFLPGVLALGVTKGKRLDQMDEPLTADEAAELKLAEDLLYTCYMMYNSTATGLAPEIAYFNLNPTGDDIIIRPADTHNLLRPETVESLFVLYRITRNEKYREWGWQIFQAFEKYSRVPSGGYVCLNDVTRIPPPPRDKMESFFLAETLKYLLLLFGDESVMPLTDYVFNTEAHPFPKFSW